MYKTHVYSLMSYYKHLCNYCPSQEKKLILKPVQRKISTRPGVGEG